MLSVQKDSVNLALRKKQCDSFYGYKPVKYASGGAEAGFYIFKQKNYIIYCI